LFTSAKCHRENASNSDGRCICLDSLDSKVTNGVVSNCCRSTKASTAAAAIVFANVNDPLAKKFSKGCKILTGMRFT
jgi:hypothetical protein